MWLIIGFIFISLYIIRKFIKGGQCKSKVRLDGKTVVVTGCNTGIGKETVVDLCGRGARVIMACRSQKRMEEAAAEVKSRTQGSGGTTAMYVLDLGDMKSIRSCAKEIVEKEERIDILINNAGVFMHPLAKTKDGLEMHMGTNHFGHFLFTNLLLEKIKASAPSRIVTVSSRAHIDFVKEMILEDLSYKKRPYSEIQAYSQSKLANILFTRELARKLEGTGVTTYSLHPGVVLTEIARHLEESYLPFKNFVKTILFPVFVYFLKSPKDGAQTTIYCAIDPILNNKSGKYYADCAESQPTKYAQDDIMAKKLWDLSEKIVGI